MISLEVRDGTIELASYSEEATLPELRDAVESFRIEKGLKTDRCAGCGECCYYETLPVLGHDLEAIKEFLQVDDDELFSSYLELPDQPDIHDRRKAISELIRDNKLDATTAALLYEYNNSEPISLRKGPDGSCKFLKDNFCSIYGARLYTCGLYICTAGEKLSVLQEQIVRQGTWHSYCIMGWIGSDDIAHNPFLGHASLDTVTLASFDMDMQDALESLFFYF